MSQRFNKAPGNVRVISLCLLAALFALAIAAAACGESEPAPTNTPAPVATPTAAPAPTATPAPVDMPTPIPEPVVPHQTASPETYDDICDRHPNVQEKILDKLNVQLCADVNERELFRLYGGIEILQPIPSIPLRASDFAGLVNLQSLGMERADIATGAISGLVNLQSLRVEGANIATGAIGGLPSLERLEIGGVDFRADMLGELPSLRSLTIYAGYNDEGTSFILDMAELKKALAALPMLQELQISVGSVEGDFELPAGLFQGNPELREVSIRCGSGCSFIAPATLVAHLDYLEELSFQNTGGGLELEISTVSPLFRESNDLYSGFNYEGCSAGFCIANWPFNRD